MHPDVGTLENFLSQTSEENTTTLALVSNIFTKLFLHVVNYFIQHYQSLLLKMFVIRVSPLVQALLSLDSFKGMVTAAQENDCTY